MFGGGDHRDSADDGAAACAAVTADDFHQDGGQQRGYKERYLNGYKLSLIHYIKFVLPDEIEAANPTPCSSCRNNNRR